MLTTMPALSKILYILISVFILMPFGQLGWGDNPISAPWALLLGLVFALTLPMPYPAFNKKASKYLLQVAVVGLGFTMNVHESLRSGGEGMLFTVVSVVGVMVLGMLLGYWMHLQRKTSYLIASGTAICGGSAIAAVGPVLRADSREMAVSLGVIFILNAVALFIFPLIGAYFGMSQQQFGTWAAIAIHDTSSVVGAGEVYGEEALRVATTIKLTRALWIIPLALVTMFVFRREGQGKSKVSIPWFIFIFIAAMCVNTWCALPQGLNTWFEWLARRGMVLTLFYIGASLSFSTIRSVGFRPLLLAIVLWMAIGVSSFVVIETTIS